MEAKSKRKSETNHSDLRSEVFSREEKLWILCLGREAEKKPLPPLFDMIDWYNNQILSKSLLADQVSLDFGAKTLLAVGGTLPVERMIVIGLGDEKALTENQAQILGKIIDDTVTDLNERAPWLIVSANAPTSFQNELSKKQKNLHTHISVS